MDISKKVSDWKINAYADISLGALIAGYVGHFAFESKKAGGTVHGIYMGAGLGASASLNLPGIMALIDKVMGSSNAMPSAGMPLHGQSLQPFCAEQLGMVHCTVFNAGVSAGVAPADIKWLQFGGFFQAQQAQATVKASVGVGSDWTAGRFIAFSPRMASAINYLDRMEVQRAMKGDGIIRSRAAGGGW